MLFVLIVFFTFLMSSTQINENFYELNPTTNLLTEEIKQIINKRIVFLEEAKHHIGSDFLAKTEFVKYLVSELGYTEIAFESDFFALYFEYDKKTSFLIVSVLNNTKNYLIF